MLVENDDLLIPEIEYEVFNDVNCAEKKEGGEEVVFYFEAVEDMLSLKTVRILKLCEH